MQYAVILSKRLQTILISNKMSYNKFKRHKPNKYPLPRRTVLYSHKKRLQPVPEVGKRYHCFDDGKITFSRHYIVKIDEVLNYMEFKRKYPEEFQQYITVARRCYWLYSNSTDKFVVTHNGENDELGVFVRTKQGGWFSIGDYFNSGELDATGKIWDNLVSEIDHFDYTDEEKEQILKEKTI